MEPEQLGELIQRFDQLHTDMLRQTNITQQLAKAAMQLTSAVAQLDSTFAAQR
jgi:hypothetical protein